MDDVRRHPAGRRHRRGELGVDGALDRADGWRRGPLRRRRPGGLRARRTARIPDDPGRFRYRRGHDRDGRDEYRRRPYRARPAGRVDRLARGRAIVGTIGIVVAMFPDLWLRIFLDAMPPARSMPVRLFPDRRAVLRVLRARPGDLFRQPGRGTDDVAVPRRRCSGSASHLPAPWRSRKRPISACDPSSSPLQAACSSTAFSSPVRFCCRSGASRRLA